NFVARCLSKRIEDRFASTRELVVALEFLGTGVSATAASAPSEALPDIAIAPAPPRAPVVTRRALRRRALVVAALVALGLAAAAAWRWFGAARNAISSLAVLPFPKATGVRLWGEKYERPFAELLRVQNSIAAGIADGLHLRLSGEERRALGGHGTANAVAYELALKARYFFLKQTEEGYLEARRLYRQAVEKDPKFADAHLGVAITYGGMAVEGFEPPKEGWARQEEEVRKALDLDPGNV